MVTLGQRVVLRYLLPAGSSHPMTDVLGVLESLDPVVVRAADGAQTTVECERVVALKAIPPRPVSRAAVRNLEHAAALGWPGLEQQWLGGWLLRAGAGFTGRANSVVPLSDPPTDALEKVRAWYAERGLPPRFHLADRLPVELPGWQRLSEILVLTASLQDAGAPPVDVRPAPDDAWLTGYHFGGKSLPAQAPAVLRAVIDGELGFGRIEVGGAVAAIARGAVTTAPDGARWLGITAVEVAAGQRRHGLGQRICAGMAAWGHEHGAQQMYLQVAADNDAAVRLYRGLGFTEHHRYRYVIEG